MVYLENTTYFNVFHTVLTISRLVKYHLKLTRESWFSLVLIDLKHRDVRFKPGVRITVASDAAAEGVRKVLLGM